MKKLVIYLTKKEEEKKISISSWHGRDESTTALDDSKFDNFPFIPVKVLLAVLREFNGYAYVVRYLIKGGKRKYVLFEDGRESKAHLALVKKSQIVEYRKNAPEGVSRFYLAIHVRLDLGETKIGPKGGFLDIAVPGEKK